MIFEGQLEYLPNAVQGFLSAIIFEEIKDQIMLREHVDFWRSLPEEKQQKKKETTHHFSRMSPFPCT